MLGGIFHFIQVLIENMQANSGDPDQTPHSVASDPGMRCFSMFVCLFDLILYVPATIFQLYRDGSSWVEPVLS